VYRLPGISVLRADFENVISAAGWKNPATRAGRETCGEL
jgi:hypothetical protein